MRESVTQKRITPEDVKEAERIEMDTETIMKLVDLIFLCRDESKVIPS